MAGLNEDQSRPNNGVDAPPLQATHNALNGADLLAGITQNEPPDQYWEDESPPVEPEAATQELPGETDSKPKRYDFFGHVHELAYSAQAQKSNLDLKAMEKEMVDKNLLPAFAIADSLGPPPLISLNIGQKQMQASLNHYRDRYFALKNEA